MVKSGISFAEVRQWGGDDVFNQGMALCQSGDVLGVEYDDDTLTVTGKVTMSSGYPAEISFKLDRGGRIKSNCPCRTNQQYGMVCPHVTALGIALATLEMDDIPLATRHPSQAQTQNADDGSPAEREPDFIEIPMKPKFYALISGSRAALSVELDAWYGDIDFPACSLQPDRTVFLPDPEDDLVRKTRSLERWKRALFTVKRVRNTLQLVF